LIDGAIDKHGRIDVIVNNSANMPMAPMTALKVEEWDRMIDVNIKGLLYGAAAVLPIMQKQKQGHIINPRFCRGLQSLRARRDGLQRDKVRRAGGA